MALTNQQYTELRRKLYKWNMAKTEMKAEPSLLNKAEIKAAFQVIEDFWENNRVTLKSNIDTATGKSISNALAKKLAKCWMSWKWGGE